jgi:hypothetical protein
MPSNKKKKKHFAYADHAVIQELSRDLSGEMKRYFAQQKLEMIRRLFAFDENASGPEGSDRVILWIRNYNITPEQETQGYTGNFAKISIVPTENGLFRLTMEVVPRKVQSHPHYLKPDRRYPNTGHPAMRAVERKTVFPSREIAQRKLADLRKYPCTNLISPDNCRTLVYSKTYSTPENKSPVRTWHLYIEECEGGFQIKGHTRAPVSRMKPRSIQAIIGGIELPCRVDECFPTDRTLVDMIFGIEEIVERFSAYNAELADLDGAPSS